MKTSPVIKHIRKLFFLLILLLLIPLISQFTERSFAQVAVYATVETTPVLNPLDAADDIAIWIHPTDTSLSTIIGTDKKGYLEVYDLTGAILQRIPFQTNNVDLRYNFPLGEERIALVTGVDRTAHKLFAYRVNPETRLLEDVSTTSSISGLQGSAMYVSPVTGKYYAFTNRDSVLKQYELYDNGSGRVAVNLVRTVTFGSFVNQTEGVTADDVHGKVYVSEEWVAIWKLGAEPTDGEGKVLVDKPIDQGGHFQPDIEGLTIYYKSDGTGYLIGSSQGNGTYTVYTREGNNDYLGTFNIADSIIDKVTGTDGIDVTNFPMGTAFPYGVFIAQDGKNMDGDVSLNQNFKLVPFESIAAALNLTMDTRWDPRLVGTASLPIPTPGGSPTPTLTPTLKPTPTLSPTPTPVPVTLTFAPIDDAYVNSNWPTKNYGAVASLHTDASPTKNFYLKFDVLGIAGHQISDAKLRLYNTNASNMGGSLMFVPDNTWSEATITFKNAPAVSGSIISSLGMVSANTWYEFDLTPLITSDGVYSVRVSSTSSNGASYCSMEGTSGFRPQLVINLIH